MSLKIFYLWSWATCQSVLTWKTFFHCLQVSLHRLCVTSRLFPYSELPWSFLVMESSNKLRQKTCMWISVLEKISRYLLTSTGYIRIKIKYSKKLCACLPGTEIKIRKMDICWIRIQYMKWCSSSRCYLIYVSGRP